MKLSVISDLHLGRGGKVDGFGHDDAEFLRFLRFLESEFERIVLLGDIFETLTGVLPGDPASELSAAEAAHPEIAARFRSPKYLRVHGNHDEICGLVQGTPEELLLDADGVRLLFTHGHQSDALVTEGGWAAAYGVWLGGWARRLNLGCVYELGNYLDTVRGGISVDSTRCAFQRAWMGRAARREVDVLVTGHTHLAARAEHGARLYLNSGSCSEGAFSYLALDTKAGNYSVHHAF
jgi:UDP-2,3-diacylglucosamine pyrophosphatase LpxH